MQEDVQKELMFESFNLTKPVLQAVHQVGYETPFPIQTQIIPHVFSGVDVIGQAQTGTGKTAAFALPLLSRIDIHLTKPQVLVLTPTRELAIQVSEAFQKYAHFMKGFHVLPIYGGQPYEGQLKRLKRGVHVVVGTPGRVMDHMRRKTLSLDNLICLVLDEADEMLRMGFIDDVEWILEQTPARRQIALFSATIPPAIRKIAQKYLTDPVLVIIQQKTMTVESTRQRYWMVSGLHKLDALTRILEAEPYDAVIIFVRTKTATIELSEKLQARGYAAEAINGDMTQNKREKAIDDLRKGKLNLLVATDVAARGLDVDRVTHVINYDIPYDAEAYIHRIGRTGRAGRSGDAILFVAPREKSMLRTIEHATRQRITLMDLPSTDVINDKRIEAFKQRIKDTLATGSLEFYHQMIEQFQQEHNIPALEIAAALAKLLQGDEPFLLKAIPEKFRKSIDFPESKERPRSKGRTRTAPEKGMEQYRIEVGSVHGVQTGNIVGAIANEAEMDAKFIGKIHIYDNYSIVDLPEGMPRQIFNHLKKTWVSGQQLNISKAAADDHRAPQAHSRKRHFKRERNTVPPKKEKHRPGTGKDRRKI